LTLASHSGVAPSRLAAFTLAPARSSMSASSLSPLYAAQCSAVAPSACGAFTLARCASNVRTAALSPRIAASATSCGPAALKALSDSASAITVLATKRLIMIVSGSGIRCQESGFLISYKFSNRPVLSPMLSW
jgi:hypothetical protein